MCSVYCVLHGYSDRGEVGERVAVRVQYTTVIVSYTDTLTELGGGGESGSYCVLHGYTDRGVVGEREWQ